MSNFIVTKSNKKYFEKIGDYKYCSLDDMILPDEIAYDSETTGLNVRIDDVFCVQLGTKINNYLIVMYNNDYTFEDLIPYIKDKTLVIHNALFDLKFCYKHNFYPKKVKDTLLASRILYNGDFNVKRHDFKNVMKRELDIDYDKTEQKNIYKVKLSQPSTILYSFNDVDKLIQLKDKLEEKINKEGYTETYNLHNDYIRALAYIEMCGMPISSEAWKNKMEQDLENSNKLKLEIKKYIYNNLPKYRENQMDMFDDSVKIKVLLSSPAQMLKVFKDFNIPCEDKYGKASINEKVIKKSDHEFVKLWLDFQESNHRVTTFGQNIFDQIDNERIYTEFNPMVDTARISSRKGSINFLNFPNDEITRNCFVANEGNVMIVCDYSSQEAVVAADLSGDKAMVASVVDNLCLHCAFARVLYPEIAHLSDKEIKKNHADKRQAAKAPRFAFSYGGNAFTIHQSNGTPLEEAVLIEKGFKELHAGLYEWGNKEFEKATNQGYIESADGWKLKLPKFNQYQSLKHIIEDIDREEWKLYREGKEEYKLKMEDSNYIIKNKVAYSFYRNNRNDISEFFSIKGEYQRLALNNPVQARSAHQLKRATAKLFNWILDNNYINKILIVNTIHDEIVLESIEELAQIAKVELENIMISQGNYYLTNLTIKADASIGKSWGTAKKG